jgi:hypothetical protein
MGSNNIATIDPLEVFINFGPKRLQGFGSGQYFAASKVNDDFTYEEGADGEGVFVKVPSNAWNLTVTLAQTSRSNDYLWTARQTDLESPGGVLLPFAIIHKGTNLVSAQCRAMRPPDISYADGVEQRVWAFLATFFEGTVQGLTSP